MIGTIIVGFIVGLLARALHPGDDNIGWIWTIILGILGSFVGGWVGQAAGWFQPGQPAACSQSMDPVRRRGSNRCPHGARQKSSQHASICWVAN